MTDLLSKKTIKEEYKLTDSIIKKIGQPDKVTDNPHYKSASPMSLYSRQRIEKWIDENKEIINQSRKRKISAEKAVNTKLTKTMTQAETVGFNVPDILREELIELSCKHYNTLWSNRGNNDKYADKDCNPEFLNRICINYLRHCMTDYDYELNRIKGKAGKSLAYGVIKDNITQAIQEKYPWLFTFLE